MESDENQGIFSLRYNLRQLFVRPPGTIPALDGVRGFAILWITGYHAIWLAPYIVDGKLRLEVLPAWARFFNDADFGVDAFFVLSGFLIGRMLLTSLRNGSTIQLGRFYLGRAFRILPTYYVVLALWAAVGGPNLDTIWSNFLFVNNFVAMGHQVLTTAWSLAIEEQFYLVMPLIMTVVLRLNKVRGLLCLLALLVLSFIVRWIVLDRSGLPPLELHDYVASPPASMAVVYRYHDVLYDKLHVRFGCLVIGVICAYLDVFYQPTLRRWFASSLAIPVLAACSILFMGYTFGAGKTAAYSVMYRNLFGLVVAASVLTSLYSESVIAKIVRALLGARMWYPIAQLSYAAYLVQLLVIGAYYGAWANDSTVNLPALVTRSIGPIYLLTFSVAVILCLLVERPFMNAWRRVQRSGLRGTSRAAHGRCANSL